MGQGKEEGDDDDNAFYWMLVSTAAAAAAPRRLQNEDFPVEMQSTLLFPPHHADGRRTPGFVYILTWSEFQL